MGLHCFRVVSLPRYARHILINLKGHVVQLVASQTAGPWVSGSIWTQSHTFVEISMVILLFPLIKEGMLSVTSETMCTKYWLTI